MNEWFVYILRCADDSLYTGITTELERRIAEHNDKDKRLGARYTRSRRPVTLIYHETLESRSLASKREAEIKRLTRQQKLLLITSTKAASKTSLSQNRL
jgi:putative endonuclease